jgi:hypothetical protein
LPFRLLHSLVGQRAERPGSMSDRPVALNLGKTSRLRTAQSVVLPEKYVGRGAADVTGVTSLSLL